MKSTLVSLTAALLVSALAQAQTSPNNSNPSSSTSNSNAPSSSMSNSSTTGTGNYSNGSGDDKWQMKTCLAQQKQANPQASKEEMKANCQKLKPSSGQSHGQ
jgi:hypothetical protein